MARIHITLHDSLEKQARTVAANMGFDLSSAIRVLLAQMVKKNGFPFLAASDGFYSAQNQAALENSLVELEADKTVTISLDGLFQSSGPCAHFLDFVQMPCYANVFSSSETM